MSFLMATTIVISDFWSRYIAGPCTWLCSSLWWPTTCGCSAKDCTYTWLWWWCSSTTCTRCAGSTPSDGERQPRSPSCTSRGGAIQRTPRSEWTNRKTQKSVAIISDRYNLLRVYLVQSNRVKTRKTLRLDFFFSLK